MVWLGLVSTQQLTESPRGLCRILGSKSDQLNQILDYKWPRFYICTISLRSPSLSISGSVVTVHWSYLQYLETKTKHSEFPEISIYSVPNFQ